MCRLVIAVLMMCAAFNVNAQFVGADPTRPPTAIDSKKSDNKNALVPNLEAIFVTTSGRRAIINGDIYLEAQNKNGLKVNYIGPDTVKIEYLRNGKVELVTLSLANASVVSRSTMENK